MADALPLATDLFPDKKLPNAADLFPDKSNGSSISEGLKGVARGAGRTFPQAARGLAEFGSDVAAYTGLPTMNLGLEPQAKEAEEYINKQFAPAKGWENSITGQVGEAVGNIGVLGGEMLTGPIGVGAAAATAFGQGAAAAHDLSEQYGGSPGQRLAAEAGMGGAQAALMAIPGVGPLLEKLPMGARNGILGYAARTVYGGGAAATVGGVQAAVNDAVEKYTVNPNKVIGEGMGQQSLVLGLAGALFHGTVGAAEHAMRPEKIPWNRDSKITELQPWTKPDIYEQRFLPPTPEYDVPAPGSRGTMHLRADQFDAWLNQNADSDPDIKSWWDGARQGTIGREEAHKNILEILQDRQKQMFGQPERYEMRPPGYAAADVAAHRPLNPRADINVMEPRATRAGATTRAPLPTEIPLGDREWPSAPGEINLSRQIGPEVMRRLQELGYHDTQITQMSLKQGMDIVQNGFEGRQVEQPLGRGAPPEPMVAPPPAGVPNYPEISGRPGLPGATEPRPDVSTPPNAAGIRDIIRQPEVKAASDSATEALNEELKRYNISDRVGLKVMQKLLDPEGNEVDAGWWKNVIHIASGGQSVADMLRNMGHEVIGHAYRDLGLYTPQEWRIISRWADGTGRKQYGIDREYAADLAKKTGNARAELARQEAWARHAEAVLSGKVREPNSGLSGLITRLQHFFEALGNWIRGDGFQDLASVMHRASSGEIGKRAGVPSGVSPDTAMLASDPAYARRLQGEKTEEEKRRETELEAQRRLDAQQRYDQASLRRAEQFGRQGMVGETHTGRMSLPPDIRAARNRIDMEAAQASRLGAGRTGQAQPSGMVGEVARAAHEASADSDTALTFANKLLREVIGKAEGPFTLEHIGQTDDQRYHTLTPRDREWAALANGMDEVEPVHGFNVRDKNGNIIADAGVSFRGDTAYIHGFYPRGPSAGPNALGPSAVRHLMEAFRKQFPKIKKVEGERISGARVGKAADLDRQVARAGHGDAFKQEIRPADWRLTPQEKEASARGDHSFSEVIGGAFARKHTPEERAIMQRAQEERDSVTKTPVFKRWFGDSQVKDAGGKPQVVYHGTGNSFEAFGPGKGAPRHPTALLGDFFTSDPRIANAYAPQEQGKGIMAGRFTEGANVVPAYLSIKNPYRMEPNEFSDLVDHLNGLGDKAEETVRQFHDGLVAQGYDGIHIPGDPHLANLLIPEEHGADTWVAFQPGQVKSAVGNKGTFDPNDARMVYARRHQKIEIERNAGYTPQMQQRMAAVVGPVDTRPWHQRIWDGYDRSVFSKIYQKTVDSFHSAAVNERQLARQGGISQQNMHQGNVLASWSAHKAMIFAGRANSFISEVFRNNGVPVAVKDATGRVLGTKVMKRNGVPGLLDALNLLKDKNLYRDAQFVLAVDRGQRLLAEGREHVIQPGDVALARQIEAANPEITAFRPVWRQFNDAMLDYAVDTGLVEPAKAQEWKNYGDYISFYRELPEGDVKGPGSMAGFTGLDPIKKLKGGQEHLGDFLENTTRHIQALTKAGLKNIAAQRAIRDAEALGQAQRLQTRLPNVKNVVEIKNAGNSEFYRLDNPLLWESLHAMDGDPLGSLSAIFRVPSQVLRTATTRNPVFAFFRHPFRESLQNALISPNNMIPLLDTLRGSYNVATNAPSARHMKSLGVSGGFDYGSSSEHAAKALRAEMLPLGKNMTAVENINAAMHKIWHRWEHSFEASDLGTRDAVFRKEMQNHGDEFEAAYQSLNQAINFNRHGSSPLIRALTGMVPFLNARIQGLDMLGRAMVERPGQTFMRLGALAGLTAAYYAMVRNDPLYKQAPDYVKDGYFIIPTGDGHAFVAPIPFEAGVLAKNIPERLYRRMAGDDLPEDTEKAMVRALWDTLKLEPEPQSLMPAVEAATNYSFFEGRPIVPKSLEGLSATPEYQYTDRTSQTARALGSLPIYPDFTKGTLGPAAPVKVDHVINGYFGALGNYLVSLIDAGIDAAKGGEAPPRAAKKITDYPMIGQILKDSHNLGIEDVDRVYELKERADSLFQAAKKLRAEGNPAAALKLASENRQIMSLRPRLEQMTKGLSAIRKQQQQITGSRTMSPEDKEQRLDALRSRQRAISSRIEEIRQRALSQ